MDIAVEDVRLLRHGRVVLDIPSLTIRGGRTTAILGPNGAGKTSLLRAIAGLDAPSTGRILAGAAPIRGGRGRPRVALLFQEDVFLRQPLRDNLELGLRMQRLPRAERRARLEDAADLLGIAHLLNRRADRLSGGEARRAGLARALCLRAPLVLLDEPLSGLDPPTSRRLLDDLPRVLEAFRATTVLVTHERDEALRLGHDLVVLVDGRVHAAGDAHEIVAHPRRASVAEVLGYTVITVDGHQVAIPPNGLALGPGAREWSMLVDDVRDLVDYRDVSGSIGGVRVHIAAPSGAPVVRPGERHVVHADRVCAIE